MAKYYLFKFSFDLVLAYPLYVLIFQNRGLSEGSIAWLLALWSVCVVALEIPAGLLSDRMTRKHLILASAVAKGLAFLVWIPAHSFAVFAAGFLLWGASEALLSGTEEAWLYETLSSEGRINEYQKIKGRGSFFAAIAFAASSLIGGYAARYGETVILLLSAAAVLVSACAAASFGNPPRTEILDEEGAAPGFAELLRSAWTDLSGSRRLLVLILASSTVLLVPGVLEEWDPVSLSAIGITPFQLGLWLSLRYIAESIGSLAAHRTNRMLGGVRPLLAASAAAAALLLVFALVGSLYLLPLYGAFYAFYALLSVQAEAQLQECIRGSSRATVLSVRSMLCNIFGIVMILGTGYLAEFSGWQAVWIASACFAAALCIAFALVPLRFR